MDFDAVVKKRTSVTHFSSKKPTPETIVELIEVANLAPTPGNLHIIHYIMVDNSALITKIGELCHQSFIRTAPYVVVVCTNPKQVRRLYDKRADRYVKHHVGAAIENFLLKVTDLGLASSLVGTFNEPLLKELLGIPEDVDIEAVLPVGYELIKGKTKPTEKQSLVTRLSFNTWRNRFYKPIRGIRRGDF